MRIIVADANAVRPIGIPLVVLAHKWDEFEAACAESELKKLATRCLRYVCHYNGASLVCTKSKGRESMAVACRMLKHHIFGLPSVKEVQLDHSRPVFVSMGNDSFANIGKPSLDDSLGGNDALEVWKGAYLRMFPPSGSKDKAADLAAVDSEKFAEEAIDECRRQRKGDVEKYRREIKMQSA